MALTQPMVGFVKVAIKIILNKKSNDLKNSIDVAILGGDYPNSFPSLQTKNMIIFQNNLKLCVKNNFLLKSTIHPKANEVHYNDLNNKGLQIWIRRN